MRWNKQPKRGVVAAVIFLLTLSIGLGADRVSAFDFPGGQGTGCTSAWCTGKGNVNAGWKRFALSGNGPGGSSTGFVSDSPTSWSDIKTKCSSYAGITEAYIFVTQRVGASSPYLGLNYIGGYPGTPGYQDATPAQAKKEYDKAVEYDPGNATGTWGSTVAAFCYYRWDLIPASSADRSTAVPGDTITWTHTVTNNGPAKNELSAKFHYQSRQGLGGASGPDSSYPKDQTKGTKRTTTSTYTVTDNDVTKNLCRATSVSPRSSTNSGWAESAPACVSVPYNYTLTPSISTSSNSVVDPGSEVTVTSIVKNAGPTRSQSTQWSVTRMIVAAGSGRNVPNKNGGNATSDPCGSYFKNASTSCQIIASGVSTFSVGGSVIAGSPLNPTTVVIDDLPVGTLVCFSLSVKARASSDSQWAHAAPVCLVTGKAPKVQVRGGDLAVGVGSSVSSSVVTATTTRTVAGQSRTFGSWSEYGLISTGIVNGMASGSAYNGGKTGASDCTVSMLTFTNTDVRVCSPTAQKGKYALSGKQQAVALEFPVDLSTPSFVDLSDATKRRVERADRDVTISGAVIGKGDWLVINATGRTVTINGDIRYTSERLQSIDDIPQLIIIANKIIIAGNVTNVDAWLVADGPGGYISTCGDFGLTVALSVDRCALPLTVNGPVITPSLYLRRTAGAGPAAAAGDPAEVFNLRPDAYLWSSTRAFRSGKASSVYTVNLPPRF